MLKVKELLNKLLQNALLKTDTASITRSSGGTVTKCDVSVRGNVASIAVTLTTTASTASGSNMFVGTMEQAYRPAVTSFIGGYTAGKSIIGAVRPDGRVTIRNASSGSIAAAAGFGLQGTYILGGGSTTT